MRTHPVSSLTGLLRLQPFYFVIAVAAYGIFWAIRPENAGVMPTLVYTLFLCNFTLLIVQVALSFAYEKYSGALYWIIYLVLLAIFGFIGVIISSTIVFWLVGPIRATLVEFLLVSWKFPLVATLIFGTGTQIYFRSRSHLESRNLELQKILEVQTARQEIQEEELQRAREIQQGLMPREIPQIAGFEIAGAWEPAREVGGDYFDVIRLSDTKLALCIADVVGKGVSAALLMANVQASVRAFASETASPSWVCSRVNSVICTNIASGKFVTLFYGVLDAETMTLLYTNAGHLRPILVSAEGKATELDNGGALLGVFPGWTYEDSTAQLRPGDRLWLVTDGITEASAEGDEEFGVHRLLESAKSLAHCTAPDCKTRLLTSVSAFCNAQFSDDATLIVLAVN